MKLIELKNDIDRLIEENEDNKEKEVVIPLAENSIGPVACAGTRILTCGFDWDSRRIFLHPSFALVRKGNSLSDVKEARREVDKYSNFVYYICSKCHQKISKNDKFCKHCSQRLKKD